MTSNSGENPSQYNQNQGDQENIIDLERIDNKPIEQQIPPERYGYPYTQAEPTQFPPPQQTTDPRFGSVAPPQPNQNPEYYKNAKKKLNWFQIKDFLIRKWWLVLILVLSIAFAAVAIFAFLNKEEEEVYVPYNQVFGTITAPGTSPSGTPAQWEVLVENKEAVSIENVIIDLELPEKTFKFSKTTSSYQSSATGDRYEIDKIAPGKTALIRFEGVLTGEIDEDAITRGSIKYTPTPLVGTNDNTRTIDLNTVITRITASEIDIQMIPAKTEVEDGSEAEITILFQNQSQREMSDLEILMTYPSNFEYNSSELTLSDGTQPVKKPDSGNNFWKVKTIPKNEQQKLTIKGNLSGTENTKATFIFQIGTRDNNGTLQVLGMQTEEITIVSRPVTIATKIEGKDTIKTFSPNEVLTFVVDYHNGGDSTIKNMEIFATIEDPAAVLDWSTLEYLDGNEGNMSNKEIRWRGSGATQLISVKPGETGQIRYKIRTKSEETFLNSSLKQESYIIRPKAEYQIDNKKEKIVAGESYRATGGMTFTQSSTYKEDPSDPNKRVYTITWTIKTRQNEVNDLRIQTSTNLPPASWSTSSITPSEYADEFTYDNNTGVIIFNLDSVSAYKGYSQPAFTASFDLVVKDSTDTQEFDDIEIIKDVDISSQDDFTGQKYTDTEKGIET